MVTSLYYCHQLLRLWTQQFIHLVYCFRCFGPSRYIENEHRKTKQGLRQRRLNLRWGHSLHLWSPASCCRTPLGQPPASCRSRGPPTCGRLSLDSASARRHDRKRHHNEAHSLTGGFTFSLSNGTSFSLLVFTIVCNSRHMAVLAGTLTCCFEK